MKRYFLPFLLIGLIACKQKKETHEKEQEDFFPVLSFIKSQVAKVDTSLYSIQKINFIDSLHDDTIYVKREEFRELAKDFLEIPDLAEKEYKKRYTEEKLFDETLQRVIISYKPVDPDKEELQNEEVLITPDVAAGDKVTSLIIDRVISNRDGYLEKKMLWQVDKSFQVTTITQKPGQPEITSTMKVTWD